MIEDIFKAIPIGFGLSFMIGPVFFMLIQTSILKGARAAIVFDLGVVVADVIFILFAYFGSHQVLIKIKDDPNLFFVGGGILFVYGLGTFLQKKPKETVVKQAFDLPEKNNYFGLIAKGFFLNFINVGVLSFWLLMIVGIGPTLDMDESRIFWFFVTVVLSYFITDLGKIFLAKQLRKKMTPTVITKIKRAMGIALMVFGLALISKGFIPQEKVDTFIENRK